MCSLRIEGDSLSPKVLRSSSLFSILLNTLKGKPHGTKSRSCGELEFWKMDLIESQDKIKFKIDAITSKLSDENIFLLGAKKLEENDLIKDRIMESGGKINCLNKALLKYQGLSVLDQERSSCNSFMLNTENMGFSGRIKIKLLSCLDVLGKTHANSEICLVVKVDGIKKAQSSFSRGKWEEEIIFDVDKALELEFLIMEKNGSVLAMIWFTFRMLIDDIKNFYNFSGILSKPSDNNSKSITSPTAILSRGNDSLESVFELEPAGKLHLSIGLGKYL